MEKRLKILVANDDGIQSEGIMRLARMASQLGDVWVAAPSSQCSGMSQKLTIADDIIVIDHGRLVGRGSHKTLLKDNTYYKLLQK